jgi:hypothetical protein
MEKGKRKKPEYKAPKIKTYEAEELEEELGFTNGSTGEMDLEGGGGGEDV